MPPGNDGSRERAERDLFVANQFGVKQPGALAGEDLAQDVENRIVFVKLIGPLVGDGHKRLRGRLHLDALFAFLFRLDRARTFRRWARGQDGKILVGQPAAFFRIHVARDANGDVRRDVVFFVKRYGFSQTEIIDVAGPSTGHVAVGMSLERSSQQRFGQHSLRAGFYAHAALFSHHVAFFIKLAENRIVEALGFE